MPDSGRLCTSQVGRWNRTGREKNHQAINEEPEAAKNITRLHTHLGERSDKAEQKEDLLGIEIITSEQERPCNEHRYEDNYAVKQNSVEIIGRGCDECLTDLRPKNWRQVGHCDSDGY